jgi:hypothetical protein
MGTDTQTLLTIITNAGFGGLMLYYVVRRLDKIQDTQSGLVQLYTILITSLPDVKKRAKDDADAINQRVASDK